VRRLLRRRNLLGRVEVEVEVEGDEEFAGEVESIDAGGVVWSVVVSCLSPRLEMARATETHFPGAPILVQKYEKRKRSKDINQRVESRCIRDTVVSSRLGSG
jgi:hypothetical protein